MSDLELQKLMPRLSWWKDVKGRVWLCTGYTYNTKSWEPGMVELLEPNDELGVPVYLDVPVVLRAIEKGQMVRVRNVRVV